MIKRTAAAPYARALFNVAVQEADPVRAGEELKAFEALLDQHPSLRKSLMYPLVPAAAKERIVREICELCGFLPAVSNLLALLAGRDLISVVEEVARIFHLRLREYQQVVDAEVTTAVALTPDRAEAIASGLAAATGKRISLSTRVDPGIVGGVVARVGSLVYDGSVNSQLARLKRRLAEGGS